MMRALISFTLLAVAAIASAAEVQVPPAVALAADMVESRIVEGHPSARWLRAVSAGLRSGRITIQEASSLLAMINHQAAFTASPVMGVPAPMPAQPAPPAQPTVRVEEDLAASLPPVEPEPAAAPAPDPVEPEVPTVAEPQGDDDAALAELSEDIDVLDAIEGEAIEAEELEVAEEGGAGGLMEVPVTAAEGGGDDAEPAAEPLGGEAAAELAALTEAADALAALEPSPDEPEPDVEGAIEALSRPGPQEDPAVFAEVDAEDPEVDAEDPAADPMATPPASAPEPVAAVELAPAAGTPAPEPAAAPGPTPTDPPPLAQVVHVKLPVSADDPTLVMVEGVGVRKGQTLSVRRDGREAVRVLVLRVEGTLSMAMVLGASWQPDAQRPLVVGDQAWPVGG